MRIAHSCCLRMGMDVVFGIGFDEDAIDSGGFEDVALACRRTSLSFAIRSRMLFLKLACCACEALNADALAATAAFFLVTPTEDAFDCDENATGTPSMTFWV